MAIIARLRFGARVSARQPRVDLGSDVTATVEFRDRDTNALTTVSGVSFAVTQADGTLLDPAPSTVFVSLGIYNCVVTPDQPGIWAVEVSASTDGVVVDRREIAVISDSIPPSVIGPTAVTSVNGRVGPAVVIGADDTDYTLGATGAVSRDVQDRLRDQPSVFDFAPAVWTEGDDDMPALLAAITAAEGGHIKFQRRRSFRIASDADLSVSNVIIDLNGCEIIQSTAGRGFLRILGDRVTLTGGNSPARFEFIGTRAPITGRFRGYTAFQRAVPVWVESGSCVVEGIESTNFFNTLCMRGPVVRNPAGAGYTNSDTDPPTAYLWDSRALHNTARTIRGFSQDFVVTGHQQEDFTLDDYFGEDITEAQDIPPHGVYMTSAASGGGGALLKDIRVSNGHIRDCPFGVAHKFLYVEGATFKNLSSTGSSGTLLLQAATGVTVGNLVSRDMRGRETVEEDSRFSLYAFGVNCIIDSIHAEGAEAEEVGLIYASGASDIVVTSATITTRFPDSSSLAAIIRSDDTAVVRVGDITHRCAGFDRKETLFADGDSRITCGTMRTSGTTKAAYAAAGASVHFGYDQAENPDMIEADMLSGTVENITYSKRDSVTNSANIAAVLYGVTTAGSNAYTERRIRVTRKGNQVTYTVGIRVNGALSSVGELRVGPLPFASPAGNGDPAVAVILGSWANITVPADTILRAAMLPGEAFIRLQTDTSGTRGNVTAAMCGSNASVQFAITIQTDAA